MDQLQQQQLQEALMRIALTESKGLSESVSEIIAALQWKEPVAALGIFRELEVKLEFLGIVLESAVRLPET